VRILICDDDKYFTNIIVQMLNREGFEVILTHNKIDAVKSVNGVKFVLMDICLNDGEKNNIEGIEAAKEIRKISDAKIIMLTNQHSTIVSMAMQYADSYFDKLSIDRIIRKIREYLKESLTTTEQIIFCHIIEGVENVSIARRMNIQYPDLKNRCSKIYKKLNMSSREQLLQKYQI
jgi:DNA-binding NarL/FixJ family response regulator